MVVQVSHHQADTRYGIPLGWEYSACVFHICQLTGLYSTYHNLENRMEKITIEAYLASIT